MLRAKTEHFYQCGIAVVEQPYPDAMPPNPLIEVDQQLRGRTAPD
ncbi:MAG: hypothetical protein AAFQ89_15895 [Cyanobacteria bacterium J06626_18]